MQTYFFKLLLIISFITLTLSAKEIHTSDLNSELNAIKLEIEKIKIIHTYDNNNLKLEEIVKKINKLENKLNENSFHKNSVEKDLSNQNKRIDDISFNISFFGILITGIIIFFSFKNELTARMQAKKEVEMWINEKADKEFQSKVDNYLLKIDKEGKNILNEISEKANDFFQNQERKLDLLINDKESNSITTDSFSELYENYINKYKNNEYKEALKIVDSLQTYCKTDIDLVKALYSKAHLLSMLDENIDSIKVYDELLSKFKNSKDDFIMEVVTISLVNKGVVLDKTYDYKRAIESYDVVINERNNSKNDLIKHQYVKALYNKAVALNKINETEKAITIYNEIISKYKNSNDLSILQEVVTTLINKGVIFAEMKNYNKAYDIFNEVIKTYGNFHDDYILGQVEGARRNLNILSKNYN